MDINYYSPNYAGTLVKSLATYVATCGGYFNEDRHCTYYLATPLCVHVAS